MNYESLKISWAGKQYVFVSREGENSFTVQEAIELLRSDEVVENEEDPVEEVEEAENEQQDVKTWSIPDNKQRIQMFMDDIRLGGIKFCADKYGVEQEDIKREAQRVAPHFKFTRDMLNG